MLFRRTIPTLLGLCLAIVLAACSSSGTPAPTGAAATAGPAASPTGAAATAAETTSAGGGSARPTGGSDLSNAGTLLGSLDSYKFDVEIQSSQQIPNSGIKAGSTSFTGIVNKKDNAQTLDMISKDASGTITDETAVVLLPDKAFLKSGVNGTWQPVPTAQSSAFTAAFSAFRPEQLFGVFFLPVATNNIYVGDEQKNGVPTAHYRGGDAVAAALTGLTGVSGQWSSDIWVAKDRGYLVHSEARGAAAAPSSGSSFSVSVDITDVNASTNTVTAPV